MTQEIKSKDQEAPDLSFILNDPENQPQAKKKMDKKVLVILILVFTLPVIIILSVVFSSSNDTRPANSLTPQQTGVAVSQKDKEVVQQFLELIKDSQYDTAFNDHVSEADGLTRDRVVNFWGPYLSELRIEQCTQKETYALKIEDGEEFQYVVVNCTDKANDNKVDVIFRSISLENTAKIIDIEFLSFDLERFRR